jgi:hypothetical protein
MIYKTFQVKTQEDYNELSKDDKNSLIIQYNKWLQDCPVKYSILEERGSFTKGDYPHKIQTLDILVPLDEPVEEKKLKKYEVQYKIDVWGSIEVEAEDEDEAEQIAFDDHQDNIYEKVYLRDFDIETDGAFPIKKKEELPFKPNPIPGT